MADESPPPHHQCHQVATRPVGMSKLVRASSATLVTMMEQALRRRRWEMQ